MTAEAVVVVPSDVSLTAPAPSRELSTGIDMARKIPIADDDAASALAAALASDGERIAKSVEVQGVSYHVSVKRNRQHEIVKVLHDVSFSVGSNSSGSDMGCLLYTSPSPRDS